MSRAKFVIATFLCYNFFLGGGNWGEHPENNTHDFGNQYSTVLTYSDYAAGWTTRDTGAGFFYSLQWPDRVWVPPTLLSNGYPGLLCGSEAVRM